MTGIYGGLVDVLEWQPVKAATGGTPPSNVYSGSVALTVAVAATTSTQSPASKTYTGSVAMTMSAHATTAASRVYTGRTSLTINVTSPTNVTGQAGFAGILRRRRRRQTVEWLP